MNPIYANLIAANRCNRRLRWWVTALTTALLCGAGSSAIHSWQSGTEMAELRAKCGLEAK